MPRIPLREFLSIICSVNVTSDFVPLIELFTRSGRNTAGQSESDTGGLESQLLGPFSCFQQSAISSQLLVVSHCELQTGRCELDL